tara:strand:+ start:487 stop:1230 length:744 start_codon:yes stop_codon:yes gene_type:complete
MSKSIIIIPSRLAATRLPNKPLIKIRNKSLIMHVYEKALMSKVGQVYVATCDNEIANEVKNSGGNFIMTDKSHTTGTDRVYEATKRLDLKDVDKIINVQGDEPMIDSEDIKNLNRLSEKFNTNISTLAFDIKNTNEYQNENVVKVSTKYKISLTSTQKAINFHRIVNSDSKNYIYQHLGIYLYKLSALKKFVKFKKTQNENKLKLEQLRALDNRMEIDVVLAKSYSRGIDTKKDLDEYMNLLNKKYK